MNKPPAAKQSLVDYVHKTVRARTKLAQLTKGSKVLEIGVGTGSSLEEDKKQFPQLRWFGTSWKEMAYRSYWKPNTKKRFVLAEGASLPFSAGSFNAIIVRGSVLVHIRKKREFLTEVYRVLKKGGRAAIHAPIMDDGRDTISEADGSFDKNTLANHREIKLIEQKHGELIDQRRRRLIVIKKTRVGLKFRDEA
ncbi:MAG: class I SAM-dependent methyltransferase [Candidatus Micrarchaeota archaeon]|nr:class I SAM-dependent methyltransferase [Candidatus Micrarchaeota archaeon]